MMISRHAMFIRNYVWRLIVLFGLTILLVFAYSKVNKVNSNLKTNQLSLTIGGKCNESSEEDRIERIVIQEDPPNPRNVSPLSQIYIKKLDEVAPLPSRESHNPRNYLNKFYDSVYTKKKKSTVYQLVLAISEETVTASQKIKSTIRSLYLMQEKFNLRVVYFTTSPSIIRLCKENGIDVVTQYITNYKGLPIVRELYSSLISLYQADYYGYMNSDILISPSIFPVLTQLTNEYNSHQLTDGFLVSGVSFDIPDERMIDLSDVTHYLFCIHQLENKAQFRDRCSSDFWIFHKTMDFSLIDDIVIGRNLVDTYLMGYVHSLHHSLVDVTYSAVSLHQGLQGFHQRTAFESDVVNAEFNIFFYAASGMEKICMSIPGDKVTYWQDGVFVMKDWNRHVPQREHQRQDLIDTIRSSTNQFPKEWSVAI